MREPPRTLQTTLGRSGKLYFQSGYLQHRGVQSHSPLFQHGRVHVQVTETPGRERGRLCLFPSQRWLLGLPGWCLCPLWGNLSREEKGAVEETDIHILVSSSQGNGSRKKGHCQSPKEKKENVLLLTHSLKQLANTFPC